MRAVILFQDHPGLEPASPGSPVCAFCQVGSYHYATEAPFEWYETHNVFSRPQFKKGTFSYGSAHGWLILGQAPKISKVYIFC